MYKKIIIALLLVSVISGRSVFAQNREGDSLALVELYDSTNGDNWTNNTNWKSSTIDTWYGVTVNGDRVTGLDMTNNNLAGSIPSSIGDLTNLINLNFLINDLTGTIPLSIENLTSLETLDLAGNDLTGSIPSEIGSLTSLTYLDIENNQLTGSIPSSIGNLSNLKTLDLNENNLDGSIPSEIGDLENLNILFLNQNELSGSIPSSIESLTKLQHLYLFDNELTGLIPPEIGGLTGLMWVRLENNQFTGSVPAEMQNLTKLRTVYLNNNDLEDLPDLSVLSSLDNLRIQSNKFVFEDIEPNIGVPNTEFIYSPQDSVGESRDTTINEGSSFTMAVSVGGASNRYQWTKGGSIISGATDSSYTISSAEPDDSGSYICEITNTVATELTLYSKPVNVTVNISGVSNDLPSVYSMNVRGVSANKKFEVRYSIPEKASIKLVVYSINGTKVKEFSEEKAPGIYSREIDMKNIPVGVYLLKMEANSGKFSSTKKIVLVN